MGLGDLNPEILRSLLGESMGGGPEFRAEFPVDSALARKPVEFLNLAKELLPEVCKGHRDTEIHDTMERLIQALELDPPGIALYTFKWGAAVQLVERAETMLPARSSAALRAKFDTLLELGKTCRDALEEVVFSIEVTGREEDLDNLSDKLLDKMIDAAEKKQAELAEKHGWERRRTPCCEGMGYVSPSEPFLVPAHDISDPRDPGSDRKGGIPSALLELLGGGIGLSALFGGRPRPPGDDEEDGR